MNETLFYLNFLWRSFFIQGIWNFERLQNIGFAYGLLPFLRALYPDPERRKEALLRHIGFFNTHPYMVNLIFGMVASLEEEMKNGESVRQDELVMLKNNMAGPLAAIGDTFFWATWRPFAALLSISLVLFFFKFQNFHGTWLAPLSFLVIYNSVPLPFRYWSLKISYQLRTRIVDIIAGLEFQYAVDMVRLAGLVVLLFVTLFYGWAFAAGMERVVCLVAFAAVIIVGCLRFSSIVIFYGVLSACIALAYLGLK